MQREQKALLSRWARTFARTCSSRSSVALGVPVAAGALFPFFGLLLSPMLAAAAIEAELGFGDRQCAPVAEN
jgi:hypothetical protein